jgi:plastocyanin
MVQLARLLTAAALVSVSVAAPMKARTNDNSYQQSGDNSYQPPSGDSSYQPPSDNSYQPPSDNSYQPPSDNSYQPPSDNSYQPPSDNSYQPPSDNSYQPPSDNSYQSSNDYQSQSYGNNYQSSSDYQTQTYDQTSSAYQTQSYDNSYQSSSDYQTQSYDNSYTTSTMMEESTMTTSSDYAYSTPSYGSGNQNWGSGYNDCVMQCAATYGMPSAMYYPPTQTSSDQSMNAGETGSNGVTHTIVVAPTQGVFRYMPFATNASVGDTVEFYWANGEHTVTQGSAVEICNKNPQGSLDSGKNSQGFKYSMVVKDEKPTWFYCAVADHCKQGMYGGININQPNPDGGDYQPLRDVAANMTIGDSDMAAMWKYTKSKAESDPYANNWGMGINVAGMDDVTKAETMKNVMWMQTLIAANPGSVDKDKGFQVTNQNMTIPGDISSFLAAANAPAPAAAGTNNGSPAPNSPTPSGSGDSAAATNAGKNGAASVASSSIATAFIAVAAGFLLL